MTPDGFLYIADTANGRIVKLKNFVEVASYGMTSCKVQPGCL